MGCLPHCLPERDGKFGLFANWKYCFPLGFTFGCIHFKPNRIASLPDLMYRFKEKFKRIFSLLGRHSPHLLWSANSHNGIPLIPLCTELQFDVFLNTKRCRLFAQMLNFNTQKVTCKMSKVCTDMKKFALREKLQKMTIWISIMVITPVGPIPQ